MIHQMTLRNFKRHIVHTMSISFEMQHFIIQDNAFELSLINCAITRNYSFLYDLSIFVNSPTLGACPRIGIPKFTLSIQNREISIKYAQPYV